MKNYINREENEIGKTIKRCREYNGYSLKELGVLSGFGAENAHSRIYQYESGRYVASPEITERIADALGVSKYAISPLNISDEKGVLFTLLKIIRKYNINIRKTGRICILEFPEDMSYLNGCMNYYYKAQELKKCGKISDEDLDFIAQSVNTGIDMPAMLNEFGVLFPFGIGVIVGVLVIAKIIEYIFEKFPLYAYWAIIGLIVASPIAIIAMGTFPVLTVINVGTGIVALALGIFVAMKLGE